MVRPRAPRSLCRRVQIWRAVPIRSGRVIPFVDPGIHLPLLLRAHAHAGEDRPVMHPLRVEESRTWAGERNLTYTGEADTSGRRRTLWHVG